MGTLAALPLRGAQREGNIFDDVQDVKITKDMLGSGQATSSNRNPETFEARQVSRDRYESALNRSHQPKNANGLPTAKAAPNIRRQTSLNLMDAPEGAASPAKSSPAPPANRERQRKPRKRVEGPARDAAFRISGKGAPPRKSPKFKSRRRSRSRWRAPPRPIEKRRD